VEAQTELQTYLEQGKSALAQGKGREAAIAYAHSAQIEPDAPQVHLGLAEANLALGNYSVVQIACKRVQALQPEGGLESRLAQALLDLLDHRYERALQNVDAVISEDPTIAYAHALRSYLLRANGQDYDANLARARAMRLSYGGRFDDSFPPLEAPKTPVYNSTNTIKNEPTNGNGTVNGKAPMERDAGQTWSRPNGLRRQVIRTRFALSRYPTLITTILIAINVIVFLFSSLNPDLVIQGALYGSLLDPGVYWHLITSMFVHANIEHLGLNMLSLFFIGRAGEIFYGHWRFLAIYLLSGIIGGVVFLVLTPNGAAVGASGAIFGVFGALGVFYLVNRRALGAYGSGAIGNWFFWLILNLGYGFLVPNANVAVWAHVGGLVGGAIIAVLLLPRNRRGRRFI